eukprot:795938-Rhodomonas_salina.2
MFPCQTVRTPPPNASAIPTMVWGDGNSTKALCDNRWHLKFSDGVLWSNCALCPCSASRPNLGVQLKLGPSTVLQATEPPLNTGTVTTGDGFARPSWLYVARPNPEIASD